MARPLTSLASVCSACGIVYDRTTAASKCLTCRPARPPERRTTARRRKERERGTTAQRGYAGQWAELSKQARYLQPWCSDCGTDEDLTTDHSPAAWTRRASGKRVRLEDVDVVCRSCNGRRGDGQDPATADEHPTMAAGRAALEDLTASLEDLEDLADLDLEDDEVGLDERLAREG